MTIPDITFGNMVEKLVKAFPELKDRYTKETEWLDKDNSYLLYNFVLFGYLEEAFKSGREDSVLLRRIFDFVEALVEHQDMGVRDVMHDVCESICSDEVVLQKAQKYMGEKTKKLCQQISRL